MLEICDAALLIGDAALRFSPRDFDILDLAEAWIEWQRRPFVFALWACREGDARLGEKLIADFLEAKEWGLAARPEIARSYAQKLSLPRLSCRSIFTATLAMT